jgi:hypothetical protein
MVQVQVLMQAEAQKPMLHGAQQKIPFQILYVSMCQGMPN